MKKIFLLLAATCFLPKLFGQTDTAIINDIKAFQKDLADEYTNPQRSPLQPAERKKFKGILFYPANAKYVVNAKFIRTPAEQIFKMPTSGTRRPDYVKYGEVHFTLKGNEYKLNVYQSIELTKKEEYKNYLFIPFRDATSGKETYGGGRYIDLNIPSGDTMLINFNKAYHPYCAYTEGYNCPIPPKENYLPVKIEAGVKL